jgi:hypothetical protein
LPPEAAAAALEAAAAPPPFPPEAAAALELAAAAPPPPPEAAAAELDAAAAPPPFPPDAAAALELAAAAPPPLPPDAAAAELAAAAAARSAGVKAMSAYAEPMTATDRSTTHRTFIVVMVKTVIRIWKWLVGLENVGMWLTCCLAGAYGLCNADVGKSIAVYIEAQGRRGKKMHRVLVERMRLCRGYSSHYNKRYKVCGSLDQKVAETSTMLKFWTKHCCFVVTWTAARFTSARNERNVR